MSKLLEIFGKGITVNTADLIWHWLTAVSADKDTQNSVQETELQKIIEQLGNLDLQKAAENLKFYLFENPACMRARLAAAALCLHQRDLKGAIEQARSVYARQPSNTLALYTLGYCLERMGRQAQALEFYQDCVKFKGHLQLPRQRMAAIYFKENQISKTILQYEQLVAEHPEDISALVLLGCLYMHDHLYEQACATFNTAIVSHPDNFHQDDFDDFQMEYQSDEFENEIEKIKWLLEQLGQMPDLYVRMGDLLCKAGRITDAIMEYETAVHVQPNYLEAAIKLGTCYLQLRRFMLAAEQFNRAVEINDEIVDAYIGLTVAQHLSGDTDDAVKTLTLSSAIQQNSTLLFSETATLHFQAAANEQAGSAPDAPGLVILLEDVIKAHQLYMQNAPASADVHYKFGMLMMAVGDTGRAVESFQKAVEINPTHYRARSKAAMCLHEKMQTAQAMEMLTCPEAMQVRDLELHYRTAVLFSDRRKFSQALHDLDKKMKENFADADAVMNIQVVLENLGLIDRAISTWDRLSETAHAAIGWRSE